MKLTRLPFVGLLVAECLFQLFVVLLDVFFQLRYWVIFIAEVHELFELVVRHDERFFVDVVDFVVYLWIKKLIFAQKLVLENTLVFPTCCLCSKFFIRGKLWVIVAIWIIQQIFNLLYWIVNNLIL